MALERTKAIPEGRKAAPLVALLLSALLLSACALAPVAPSPERVGAAALPTVPAPPVNPLSPSDVASVPPHSGTVVYEAVQPDPSNMPRDLVLVLYADRKAALLDRVIGDPTTPFTMREGTWSLSDAGSVRLYLDEKDGTDFQLLLKRGEGFLTGDGSRFGGGILYLREI